ncbi:WD repeat-containing protein 75-like isoform X1 [Ornithodoros turicata]|uniref:WD repeat-containing protein 75-like isoform X1 n=1 Tax=Ornithodoros turicata TaxID=34597 RepID=UPI0031398AB7
MVDRATCSFTCLSKTNSSTTFVLNTNVYLPHYKRVNDLQFRTTQELAPLAVTTGQDGKFRSWALFEEDIPQGDEKMHRSQSWNCMQSGSYRGLPCGRAAFSQDGSLLALTFCHLLTLWAVGEEQDDEAPPAKLCASLSDPSSEDDISALEFGRDTAAHMVVTCTSSRITIWNVITLSLHWSRDWTFSCLASDPLSQRMAAFSADGSVLLFDPKSIVDKPLYEGEITEEKGRAARAAIFVPSGNHETPSGLYFLNCLQELYSLEPQEGEEDVQSEPSTIHLESGMLSSTPFGALVAERTKFAVVEDGKTETLHHSRLGVLGFKEVQQLLDMNSHTLPWLSIMCQDFMASFLNGTSESVGKGGHESEEHDDSSSDMHVDEVEQKVRDSQNENTRTSTTTTTVNTTVFGKLEDFGWLSKPKREI